MASFTCRSLCRCSIQDPLLRRHLTFVLLALQLAGQPEDDAGIIACLDPAGLRALVAGRLHDDAAQLLSRYLRALSVAQAECLRRFASELQAYARPSGAATPAQSLAAQHAPAGVLR